MDFKAVSDKRKLDLNELEELRLDAYENSNCTRNKQKNGTKRES